MPTVRITEVANGQVTADLNYITSPPTAQSVTITNRTNRPAKAGVQSNQGTWLFTTVAAAINPQTPTVANFNIPTNGHYPVTIDAQGVIDQAPNTSLEWPV